MVWGTTRSRRADTRSRGEAGGIRTRVTAVRGRRPGPRLRAPIETRDRSPATIGESTTPFSGKTFPCLAQVDWASARTSMSCAACRRSLRAFCCSDTSKRALHTRRVRWTKPGSERTPHLSRSISRSWGSKHHISLCRPPFSLGAVANVVPVCSPFRKPA